MRAAIGRHRGVSGFLGGLITASAVVGAGVAIAAIPSTATGSYTGCVNDKTGVLRVIDAQAGRRCASTEKTITWSRGYRYRGTWRSAMAYSVDDVVVQDGSSYLAKGASTGKLPSANPSLWGVLAARGLPGPPGLASKSVFLAGPLTTSSSSPAELGYPTLTVDVGDSGLAEYWITATIATTGGGTGIVELATPGFDANQLANVGAAQEINSTPDSVDGTNAPWSDMSATWFAVAGPENFNLFFSVTGGVDATATFTNIQITVVPL